MYNIIEGGGGSSYVYARGKNYYESQIVVRQELVSLEIRGHILAPTENPNKVNNSDELNLVIRRNLVDDTFTLSGKSNKDNRVKIGSEGYVKKPYFAANNSSTAYFNEGIIENPTDKDKISNLEARSFALNHEKFSTSTSWSKGTSLKLGYDKYGTSSISVFPHFGVFNNQASITEDQILQIDLIKQIQIEPDFLAQNATKAFGTSDFTPAIYYTHILVVPKPSNQFTHQVDIVDVYAYNDIGAKGETLLEPNNYFENFDFGLQGKYSSSAFTGAAGIALSDQFAKSTDVTRNPYQIYKVGTMGLIDQTYYDFDTNKTVLGFSENSEQGEMVPFNFEGNLTRKFDLGINQFLKKFQLSISRDIKQKALDPYAGLVVLDLKEESDSGLLNSNWKILTGEKLQNFRDVVKESSYMPLVGIERFSDE